MGDAEIGCGQGGPGQIGLLEASRAEFTAFVGGGVIGRDGFGVPQQNKSVHGRNTCARRQALKRPQRALVKAYGTC
jgi:hypothetical protein